MKSTFQTDVTKVGLFFSISDFFYYFFLYKYPNYLKKKCFFHLWIKKYEIEKNKPTFVTSIWKINVRNVKWLTSMLFKTYFGHWRPSDEQKSFVYSSSMLVFLGHSLTQIWGVGQPKVMTAGFKHSVISKNNSLGRSLRVPLPPQICPLESVGWVS